jgi:small-conductance mechanosensitive channel
VDHPEHPALESGPTRATKRLHRWVVHKLLAKSPIELGIRDATASILRYAVLTIGFVIIFQSVGLDLSSLTILFGALGVGASGRTGSLACISY